MSLSILLLCTATAFGGAETHALNLYKKLLANDHKATICVAKESPLERQLKQANLPHHSLDPLRRKILGISVTTNVSELIKICQKENITIIHCNEEKEVIVAKKLIRNLPKQKIAIVFTRHVLSKLKRDTLKDVSSVIGVSKPIVNYVENHIKKTQYNPPSIYLIPPFFEPTKFINYKPTTTKTKFFKNNYNITISNKHPLLCMIANLYPTKNHKILLNAMHKLVHDKKINLELVLAGRGPLEQKLKHKTRTLGLNNHVHFLGFTKKIPDILHHADINILCSKQEGLGIALLEAGLMRTPSIAASGSGMSDIIQHNKTGLLFKNKQTNDLVEKIETLIRNKHLAMTLGANAYTHVKKKFSIETNFKKYLEIYKNLAPHSPHHYG